ncbi:hypothetical protein EDM56_27790 [Brevibacillus fluminis]|uniref:Uncharacterized protein n=1 Tax=Brevibacillus fluminis TaxID=511487 RepID=A0A3M8CWK1_9BACL|nr:hypothetical protein [Brevibacillus fluminis]RNB80212.1 hypothetical protein EDM56_27790 [Brevibacillus fluminis]
MDKRIIKIEPPKIPSEPPELKLLDIHSNDLFEMGMIQDCLIDNQKASKVTFEKIIFKNVTFTETTLTGVEFTDVLFEK